MSTTSLLAMRSGASLRMLCGEEKTTNNGAIQGEAWLDDVGS